MIGPGGKYDDHATRVRNETGAEGLILLVFAGDKGSGFSVQAPLPLLAGLPVVLRQLADSIEADMNARGVR